MDLVQILSLSHHLDFSAETSNPQVVTLWRHEVWLQPNNRSVVRGIPGEVKELSFKVTSECNVDQTL